MLTISEIRGKAQKCQTEAAALHNSNLVKVAQMNAFMRRLEAHCLVETDPRKLELQAWTRTTTIDGVADFVTRNENVIDLIENYALYWMSLTRARNSADVTRATICLCKTISKRSFMSTLANSDFVRMCLGVFDMATVELQSDWFIDGLDDLGNLLGSYEKIKACKLFSKFSKVVSYTAMFGIFNQLNIPLKSNLWDLSQSAPARRTIMDAPDFAKAILDLILYTLRQGRQSYLHGSVMHMFHSEESYEQWLDRASLLKLQSKFLSNPAALQKEYPDFTEPQFIADLKDVIEKGKCMVQILAPGIERRFVKKILCDIQEIDANFLTKQAAQQFRKMPLGIFIYGYPGVGKSSVMDIMYSYFAAVRGLPTDSKYMYTKNSAAKFWDGFASYMWCVVLDDVACFRASKVMGVDESIQEIIKVLNTIPYTPDQASLDDKGKTPVKAELVFATSNVEDMSLPKYFEKSGAAVRRFAFRVKPSVKDQYATEAGMLDSSKVPPKEPGMYDDLWTFEIHRAQTYGDMGGDYNDPEPLKFDNIIDFLLWYGSIIKKHFASQEMMVDASIATRSVEICKCGRPVVRCTCVVNEIQNLCVKCKDLPNCVNCTLCNCVCACDPAVRRRYNERRSQHALQTITDVQVRKMRQLEEDYVTYIQQAATYDHDEDDDFDEVSEVIDCNVVSEPQTLADKCLVNMARVALYLVYEFTIFRDGSKWLYSFPMMRRFVHRHLLPRVVTPTMQKMFMRRLGRFVDRRLGACRMTDVMISLLMAVSASVTLLWVLKKIVNVVMPSVDPEPQVKVMNPQSVQKTVISAGRVPSYEKEENENPWFNDTFFLTQFDVSTKCTSMLAEPNQMFDIVRGNVGHVVFTFVAGDVTTQCAQNVVCVGGNTFVVNTHSLRGPSDLIYVEILFGARSTGINNVIRGTIRFSDVKHLSNRDVSMFQLLGSAPRKDIRKFFAPMTFEGHFDGYLIIRRENGDVEQKKVTKIRKERFQWAQGVENFDCKVFSYSMATKTEKGDCGALLCVVSGYGPQLVGYHFIYNNATNRGLATQLASQDLDEYALQADFPVMSPREPALSAPGYEHILGSLDKKSPVLWVPSGNAAVFGSLINESRSQSKSKVARTPICKDLCEYVPTSFEKFEVREGPPSMHPYFPWHRALTEMTDPIVTMDTSRLKRCAQAMLKDILGKLPASEMAGLHPYDVGTAVNGAPGLKFVDKMNRATSAGFPFNTTKKKFMHSVDDERWADGVEFDENIMRRVADCLDGYKRGELYAPVFSGCLKDEPKAFAKARIHKTRVFTGGPADWGLVVRMYYLPLIRIVQRNKFIFESGPGTNAHSLEWEEIREHLTTFGNERLIAGDYASFDKKMATNATMYAYWLMIEICKASGNYTEEDEKVLWGVAMDTCYPLVNFNGDLIQFHCGNPSGQPLTVILNGFVNALYIRYVYDEIGYELETFQDMVKLMTYGDDNAMGVSEMVPLFTHTRIQAVLAGVGIGYTMADKEAVSRPYIHIDEVSFLKRIWRYEEELDAYVAPLEWGSINKMLTVHVRSRNVSSEEQIVAACSSAVSEAFYHGREVFEELTHLLKATLEEKNLVSYIEPTTFPTWCELVDRFERSSRRITLRRERKLIAASHDTVTVQAKWSESTKKFASMGVVSLFRQGVPQSLYSQMCSAESRKKDLAVVYGPKLLLNCRSFAKMNNNNNNNQVTERTGVSTAIRAHDVYELQADVITPSTTAIDDAPAMMTSTMAENVAFTNEGESEKLIYSRVLDDTYGQDAPGTADLRDFLGRPVEIDTFTWTENSSTLLQRTMTPWHLFFNDVRIKKKIDNFAYVKGNLHLKFTINASPFYYGSIGAFYRPLSGQFDNLTTSNTLAQIQVPISQRPHIWLNPQEVSTSEMVLPFFNPRNWLRLGVAQDFINFGTLDLWQYATLRSANGVTGSGVTITTYAWMEDVQICGPTVALSMQSRKRNVRADSQWWRPNGQISDLASKVADVGGAMGKFGALGKYAGSTVASAATAVGDMAAMFGFTNTPIISDVMPFKSLPFHSLAGTEISEPVSRLTLDPKQSLDIDSTTVGLDGTDELGISYLCQKESFLTGTLWATTSPKDTLLFSGRVTPMLYNSRVATFSRQLYTTPMCMVGQMFQQWRGDIIFRFKFIRSKYHRGRVRITWDPVGSLTDTVSTTVAYTQIVDLENDDEVEIRVPYMGVDPFLKTWPKGAAWSDVPFSNTTTYVGTDALFANGTITMRVLNALTAPETSSDIDVLVFVKAAENLEFANPTLPPTLSPYVLQSKVSDISEGTMTPMSDVIRSTVGERVISLRQLLHRSSLAYDLHHPNLGLNSTQHNVKFCWILPKMPLFPGYDVNGLYNGSSWVTPGTDKRINWSLSHPLSFWAPCFVGRRGSVTWHHNITYPVSGQDSVTKIAVSRVPENSLGVNDKLLYDHGNYETFIGSRTAQRGLHERGNIAPFSWSSDGLALTNQLTQAGMSTNVPHYSKQRFFVNNALTWWNALGTGDAYALNYTVRNEFLDDYRQMEINAYACAGPDFNYFYFLNTPDYVVVPQAQFITPATTDPPIAVLI